MGDLSVRSLRITVNRSTLTSFPEETSAPQGVCLWTYPAEHTLQRPTATIPTERAYVDLLDSVNRQWADKMVREKRWRNSFTPDKS